MALFLISISGVTAPIEVYGGLSACSDWLGSSSSTAAQAFNALADDDEKGKRLVDATRYIDSIAWQGAPDALGGTTLQWPRSGIVTSAGVAVSDAAQLAAVSRAAFELAGLIAADPDVITATDAGSNVRAMGAGSARIEFFRPVSLLDGNTTMLPVVVSRLIGKWLASASPAVVSAASGTATGTSTQNDFDVCAEDKIVWPL